MKSKLNNTFDFIEEIDPEPGVPVRFWGGECMLLGRNMQRFGANNTTLLYRFKFYN
jgi:hypothetical protein